MPPCAATVFPGRHIEAGFDRRAADRARPSRGGYRHLALPGAPRRTGIADSAHFAASVALTWSRAIFDIFALSSNAEQDQTNYVKQWQPNTRVATEKC
jgi:hypothetical protein